MISQRASSNFFPQQEHPATSKPLQPVQETQLDPVEQRIEKDLQLIEAIQNASPSELNLKQVILDSEKAAQKFEDLFGQKQLQKIFKKLSKYSYHEMASLFR